MIALLGDIHGMGIVLEKVAALPGVTAIIQLGDFGLARTEVPALSVPLYWIDGNHEHYPSFAEHQDADEPVPWAPGCWYVPRGHLLTLEGTRFLCLGGADSVDFHYRKTYPQERITKHQLVRALQHADDEVDLILTHTPPQSTIATYFPGSDLRAFGLPPDWTSGAACAVEVVAQSFTAPIYCGHMHKSLKDDRGVRILDINEYCLLPDGASRPSPR